MLDVRCIDDRGELEALAPAWNALLRRSATPHAVSARYEWARAWLDAFGIGSRPQVLAVIDRGTLRGILPLRSVRARFAGLPMTCLETMANGHAPRADLLVEVGSETDVLTALAAYLRDRSGAWDIAMLSEVVAGSPLFRLYDLFPASGRLLQPQRRPPYIVLDGDWDGFWSSLSRNFRRALRNNRNRVTRAGCAELELVEAADALEAGLTDIVTIGAASWQGDTRSAIGSCPPTSRFYSDIIRSFGPEGLVRLWFLRLGGHRVAYELHLRSGGVEYGLKTGYRRDYASLGVGTFLDQSIVERLFAERAADEYDLLGDSDPYKLRWTGRTRDVVRVSLFPTSARSQVLASWNRRLKPRLRSGRDWLRARAATVLV